MNNSGGANRRLSDEVTGETTTGAAWYQPLVRHGKVVCEVSLRIDRHQQLPINLMSRRIVRIRPRIVYILCAQCGRSQSRCQCSSFYAREVEQLAIDKDKGNVGLNALRKHAAQCGLPSVVEMPDQPHTFVVCGLESGFDELLACQWVASVERTLDVNVHATLRSVGSADASACDRQAYKDTIREMSQPRLVKELVRHADYKRHDINDKAPEPQTEKEQQTVSERLTADATRARLDRYRIEAYLDRGEVPTDWHEDQIIDLVLADDGVTEYRREQLIERGREVQVAREERELDYHQYVREAFAFLMTIDDVKVRRSAYWSYIQNEKYHAVESKEPAKRHKRKGKRIKEEKQQSKPIADIKAPIISTEERTMLDHMGQDKYVSQEPTSTFDPLEPTGERMKRLAELKERMLKRGK